MMSSLISVLDRLIQLKEYRTRRLRHIYSELLKPVFDELAVVHGDYVKMFTEVHQKAPFPWERNIPGYQDKLKEVVLFLQQRRVELEPARIRIRVMVKELSSLDINSEVHSFVNSVIDYLFTTITFSQENQKLDESSYKSVSETILDRLEKAIQEEEVGKLTDDSLDALEIDIRELIGSVLSYQRDSWEEVCKAFSELKINIALKG